MKSIAVSEMSTNEGKLISSSAILDNSSSVQIRKGMDPIMSS